MSNLKTQREIIRQNQKSNNKRRSTLIVVVVTLIAVIALAAWLLPRLGKDKPLYAMQNGFSVGDPNAPVKVVEYSNYTCSHCQDFALNLEEAFVEKYVDSGQVFFTFHNFPFEGDRTGPGVAASHCAAEQNAFWQYKKLLFTYSGYPGGLETNSLFDYAKRVGLDEATFKTCFEAPTTQAKILSDREAAVASGISATPSFLVNGTLVYMDTLNETVEAALN